MIGETLGLLRFVIDPETRKTVQALTGLLPRVAILDWKSDVKTATAEFSGIEGFKVPVFANAVLADMRTQGVSAEAIQQYRTVFEELVRNAFEHGCEELRQCKITIHCTYSRYFIVLQVADTGGGFNLAQALAQSGEDIHGLQLVNRLAFRFTGNERGNSLTAILVPPRGLRCTSEVMDHGGKKILRLTVLEGGWSYSPSDWEPLRKAATLAPQKLILIDCTGVTWVSATLAIMIRMVKDFKRYHDRRFALIIDSAITELIGLPFSDTRNFRLFVNDGTLGGEETAVIDFSGPLEWLCSQQAGWANDAA